MFLDFHKRIYPPLKIGIYRYWLRFPDTDNSGVLLQVVQHGAVRVPDDVNVETLADQRLGVILHPWAPANVAQDHHSDVLLFHFHCNPWNRKRLRRSHFHEQEFRCTKTIQRRFILRSRD